jgi:hypothetical protein
MLELFNNKYRVLERGYYYIVRQKVWWFPLIWLPCWDYKAGELTRFGNRDDAIEYMNLRKKNWVVAEV